MSLTIHPKTESRFQRPNEPNAGASIGRTRATSRSFDLRCARCGYGVAVGSTPDRCPMCSGSAWVPAARRGTSHPQPTAQLESDVRIGAQLDTDEPWAPLARERAMAKEERARVTVIVADDHPLYRDGVVRALRASGRIEILAEAPDGASALAAIQEHLPDVAVIDYKLPDLDGVAVTHAVVGKQLPTRVLIVSAFTNSGVVYRALETGAAGFVSKEARREDIVAAVLACARGENVVPPEIAAGLVSEIRLRRQATGTPTPRKPGGTSPGDAPIRRR